MTTSYLGGGGSVAPPSTPPIGGLAPDQSSTLDSFNSSSPDLTSIDPNLLMPYQTATNTTPILDPGALSTGGVTSNPLAVGGTAPANTAASSTASDGGLSSILSGIGTGLSSVLGSGAGQLGLFAGLYGLEASQASGVQSQNAALAGQISNIGAPDLTAGQQLLSATQVGQLTGAYQTEYQTAATQAQQQATSQQQQVAQLLANSGGGQNAQSGLASETQQIQTQQQINTNAAMSQAFTQQLAASLNLTNTGGQYVEQGILTEIQSNTQLQQQLSSLMAALASAYAKSSGGGTGAGGAAGGAAAGSSAGNLFGQASKLLNLNSNTSAIGSTGSSFGLPTSPSLVSGGDISGAGMTGTDVSSALDTAATSGAGDVASAINDASDILDFSAAGGAAAAGSGALGAGAAIGGEVAAADAATAAAAGAADVGAAAVGADVAAGAGADAAAAAGAGIGGDLAGLAAVAPYAAAIAAIGYGIYSLVSQPDTKETITNPSAGNVIKLQSGNSALQVGNVAFGAGTSRGAGSAEWFITPTSSMNTQAGNLVSGQPFALSSADSKGLTNLVNGVGGYLSTNADGTLNQASVQKLAANPPPGLLALYNRYGGQAGWGQDMSDWITSMWKAKNGVTGDLTT